MREGVGGDRWSGAGGAGPEDSESSLANEGCESACASDVLRNPEEYSDMGDFGGASLSCANIEDHSDADGLSYSAGSSESC